MTSINILDLYCGAGGFSEGFHHFSEYNILAGIDNWKPALETYRFNHSSVGLQIDMSEEDPETVPVSSNQVDMIIGGPPCKGFSLAGKREENDERNQLVSRYIDYVEYFEPDIAVMENVVGILSMDLPGYDNGDVKEYIYERYSNLGYNIDHKTLSANDFGIPQTRSRVFFIAVNEELGDPVFPEETTSETVQKSETILQQNFELVSNHNKTNHSDDMVDRLSELSFEESLYDKYTEAWKRIHPEKPAPTIKENHGAPFVHPYKNRVGTPRECAALQSFPNTYQFKGSKSNVLKQIGNAVPPKLAEHIAKEILQKLYLTDNSSMDE